MLSSGHWLLPRYHSILTLFHCWLKSPTHVLAHCPCVAGGWWTWMATKGTQAFSTTRHSDRSSSEGPGSAAASARTTRAASGWRQNWLRWCRVRKSKGCWCCFPMGRTWVAPSPASQATKAACRSRQAGSAPVPLPQSTPLPPLPSRGWGHPARCACKCGSRLCSSECPRRTGLSQGAELGAVA